MQIKKIILFLILTFFISWPIGLTIYLLDLNLGSIKTTLLIAGPYMFGPAIATLIIQKLIYKESMKKCGWSFNSKNIKQFLKIPIIFLGMIFFTLIIIFLFGNLLNIDVFGNLDFSQESFNSNFINLIKSKSETPLDKIPELPSKLMFIAFILQGTIIGGLINIPIMFGEEFGWRGLLLYETKNLGFLKSSLFIGFFWGLWHLPLIIMGLNYADHPYTGIMIMCLLTISLSPIFTYVRVKTKSIIGACIIHGMLNGTATIFLLYTVNGNDLFNSIAGFAGILANVIVVSLIYYFDKEFIRDFNNKELNL